MLIALTLSMMLCGVGKAQEIVPTTSPLPPKGRTLNYESTQYRCFNLEEYKQIAIDYVNYGQLREEKSRLDLTLQLKDVELEAWERAASVNEAQIKALNTSLNDERQLRLDDNESAKRQRWYSLTVILVAVLGLGAVGTLEVVK